MEKLKLFFVLLTTISCMNCLSNLIIDLNSIRRYIPKIDKMVSSVCYPELESCFNQNLVYDIKNRRLTFYTPQTLINLNIKLHLLKRLNDSIEQSLFLNFNNLTDESNQLSTRIRFSSKQPTLVFIPGWIEEYKDFKNWIQILNDWPDKDNYQVIVVNWSQCSMKCTYEQAVTNSKVISKVLSIILFYMDSQSMIDLNDTHLIGRNIGSHIAGQIGNDLMKKGKNLFKITAFDPPFDLFQENNDVDKVDINDANHVEVIHTNANQKEFVQNSIGLVDVFVYDSQPSKIFMFNGYINQSEYNLNSEVDLRMRAAIEKKSNYRTEKDCHLLAFRCESYQMFLEGKCSTCDNDEKNCKLIGLWSNQLNTKFNKLNKTFQYYSIQNTALTNCVYHYRIQVTIGSIFKNRKSKGIIQINIRNETVSIQEEFSRNQTYTKLFTSVRPLTNLKHIKIIWTNLATGLWVFTYSNAIHIEKIELNYISSLDERIRHEYSSIYCLSNLGTNVIAHKQFINLKKCL